MDFQSGEPAAATRRCRRGLGTFALWDSSYNVDAAPADEKNELLAAGAWCYADD